MPLCRAVPHSHEDVGCKIQTAVLAHAAQQPVGGSGPTASLQSPAWTLTGPPGISSDPRSSGWEALFHSPNPASVSMTALNPADGAAVLPPDAAAASMHVLPSPSSLPFGDKDPYGDAAATQGGAMSAQYQPHQGPQGYSPTQYMPTQAAPTYINRLAVDIHGNAIAPPPSSYQPGSQPDQALTDSSSNIAAASSPDAAAWLVGGQPSAPPPDQAYQADASRAAAASPTDAAVSPPAQASQANTSSAAAGFPSDAAAPPPPTSPPDQASQGRSGPAQSPSVNGSHSQQATSAPDGVVPVQPFALPPVTASAQSDQQPLLKVYQDSADRWRKIAIAGVCWPCMESL